MNASFETVSHPGQGFARRAAAIALLLLLALGACRSPVERANALEAQYDRQMNRGMYDRALQSIGQAVQYDESQPRRWLKLAKVQDVLDRHNAAATSYQRALDLEPYNIEALENLAVLSVRGGQYDVAKRYIDPLLLLSPNDLAGLLASGAVAVNAKRYADAERIAAQIIATAPGREEGYVLRARVLELTGHPQAGLALLEQREIANPNNRDLPVELLNMYRRQGSIAGIRRTAIRLMALFPNEPRYALESVRAYHAMKRDDEARRIIAQLSERYAHNAPIMIAVAGLWRDIAPPEEAGARIAAAATKSPGRVGVTLANILTDMGQPARAAALLAPLAAGSVTPETIEAQAIHARALYALGQSAAAERKVTEILAFDEDNPVALLLRARFALARGDYAKAATDAGVVASDDGQNLEAALLLATVYARQGNALLAAKAYGDARKKFPGNTSVLRAQTDWMLSQSQADAAVDVAASYAHAHRGRIEGWQVYRDVCARANDASCLAEARTAIARLQS